MCIDIRAVRINPRLCPHTPHRTWAIHTRAGMRTDGAIVVNRNVFSAVRSALIIPRYESWTGLVYKKQHCVTQSRS